jgi:hypothetical protein
VRRLRGPAGSERSGPVFYTRFLRVLADQFGLVPAAGQTPLEFSRRAAETLRSDPRTMDWAFLPTQLADALYRLRYGGQTLAADDLAALNAQIGSLERVIAVPSPKG